MQAWQADKRWSDRFLPEIKAILGTYLIAEPPMEEDAERNTDLMVLRMDTVRVGCRVRRSVGPAPKSYPYLARHGHQFTIRSGRTSGVKTELTKIIEGWGDYFFYGFCDEQERTISQWMLADLRVFRIWLNRQLYSNGGRMPGEEKPNGDESSTLRAFNIRDLPDEFVIARQTYREVA